MRDALIADVKSQSDIVAVVGERVELRRDGVNFKGLCPFHAERSGSFSVNPEKQLFHCFGCGKSGNVIQFVQAVDGVTFNEALETLARRAGVATEEAPARPLRPAPPAVDAASLWASLPPLDSDCWDYLRDRDLDDTADLCRSVPEVGAGALAGMRLAVAMRDHGGRVVAIQARNLASGKAHDFRVAKRPEDAGLFGDPSRLTLPSMRSVFLVEGLTDYLAASIAVGRSDKAIVLGVAGANNTAAVKGLPVKGLRCIVATDADDTGEKCAADLIASLNAAGGVAVRARPPEGHKDLCDMRSAGVDLRAWLAKATEIDLGFRNYGERIVTDRAQRLADAARAIPFQVSYLDAGLGGIDPRDVILVGAESGYGKTQLVTIIAMLAAAAGKRVHYFALEPEPLEIERRIKYQYIAPLILGGRVAGCDRLTYRNWHRGQCDDITGPYEAGADRALAERYQTLRTFYRSEKATDFTAADFNRMARALGTDSDLNILDHVHYFDEDDDPNRGQRRASKQFRDLAIQTGVPLIEVAHMRKKPAQYRKNPRLMPERDDFEGSSHLFKPVKKAIILAPARDQKGSAPWKWPTYIAIVKSTIESTVTRYVAVVEFNARTNTYEPGFVLGEMTKNGEKFEPVAFDRLPQWARP